MPDNCFIFLWKQLALQTLLHASQCISPRCENKECRKMKLLFKHAVLCKVRQSGGCLICKKVWYLMQLHCSSCQDLNCKVARCRYVTKLLYLYFRYSSGAHYFQFQKLPQSHFYISTTNPNAP